MINLFGKREPPPDPSQLAKEWRRRLQKECRDIDRNIANLKREEAKAMTECKKLAKSGHLSSSKILIKQIAQTRKATERMYMAKAQMNSVSMQLQSTASMVKLKSNIGKSAEIMATMNGLMNIQEVSKTMHELAREMERAGLIEEVIDDTFSSLEPEGLDKEVDLEAERIYQEIASETFAKATDAPTEKLKVAKASEDITIESSEAAEVAPSEAEDEEFRAMQSRLQSL